MDTVIKKAINKGLIFLIKEQKKNEYFSFETIFPSILILDCLNEIKIDRSKPIKEKLYQQILEQKSNHWSFNYWRRDSKKYNIEPYPDDLDDTFLALSALFNFDKSCINGESLAKIINLLVLSEAKEGGPYRTWILPKEKSKNWDDVDVAVNSNVGYFLKLNDIKLKNLKHLIEKRIIEDKLTSPFYKGEIPVIYFISRFYKGKLKDRLKQKLVKAINHDSCLDLALIISSLIRLGYRNEIKREWLNILTKNQRNDGAWEGEDFYFYIDKTKGTDYIGSKSISTAFILEALSLIDKKEENKNDDFLSIIDGFKKDVISEAEKVFSKYPVELKDSIDEYIKNFAKNDSSKVAIATPLIVLYSLDEKLRKKISNKITYKLGLINLLGWCAYTIFDNIIDKDCSQDALPLANIFYSELETALNTLPIDNKTGFFEFKNRKIKDINIGNWWEQKHLTLDNKRLFEVNEFNYEYLANKSIGHAISSVAILCYLGYSVKSKEVIKLMEFFKYFIIARQMNDDAHDYYEDLEKGQINSAGFELIKYLRNQNGDVLEKLKDREKIKIIFWQRIIPNYCKKLIAYANKGAKAIESNQVLVNKKGLIDLNYKNIELAKNTLKERKMTLEFIKSYYK